MANAPNKFAPNDPVVFTASGAKQLDDLLLRTKRQGPKLHAERNPTPPAEDGFWAMLFGNYDLDGLLFHFVRVEVIPDHDEASFTLGKHLAYRFVTGDGEPSGYAIEASGLRGIRRNSVVWLRFIGYDSDDLPRYMFSYGAVNAEPQYVPPHDHRDNYNGGFAFACYHPGTALPQMPWAA